MPLTLSVTADMTLKKLLILTRNIHTFTSYVCAYICAYKYKYAYKYKLDHICATAHSPIFPFTNTCCHTCIMLILTIQHHIPSLQNLKERKDISHSVNQ